MAGRWKYEGTHAPMACMISFAYCTYFGQSAYLARSLLLSTKFPLDLVLELSECCEVCTIMHFRSVYSDRRFMSWCAWHTDTQRPRLSIMELCASQHSAMMCPLHIWVDIARNVCAKHALKNTCLTWKFREDLSVQEEQTKLGRSPVYVVFKFEWCKVDEYTEVKHYPPFGEPDTCTLWPDPTASVHHMIW